MIKRLRDWLQGSDGPPAEAARVRVLMVCMGNICRSPTASSSPMTRPMCSPWALNR